MIILDPGHGGNQTAGKSSPTGARGRTGLVEKNLTLQIAGETARSLGGRAVLTRTADVNRTVGQRIDTGRRNAADAFVSVHVGYGTGGSTVWVHPQAAEASIALARRVARGLEGPRPVPVRYGNLAVLSPERHARGTAACLVELGDLRDPSFEGRMRDGGLERYGRQLAEALWSDSHNDSRRSAAKVPSQATAQLDHMISQKRWADFSDTYEKVLKPLSNGAWTNFDAALDALEKAAAKVRPNSQLAALKTANLINIRANIVPGIAQVVGGTGDRFDPQVHWDTKTSIVTETPLSRSLRAADLAILELGYLVAGAKVELGLPRTSKNKNSYDQAVEGRLVALLAPITKAFADMDAASEPSFEGNVWSKFGTKWVKTRPGHYLDGSGNRGAAIPAKPAWAPNTFTFDVPAIGAGPKLVDVSVDVDLKVPATTWNHIYNRHVFDNFGHDEAQQIPPAPAPVEAVNTFWKTDPHTLITGTTSLIEAELETALRERVPFARLDQVAGKWFDLSGPVDKLFIQGGAQVTVNIPDDPSSGYNVEVKLTSIAPQHQSLGNAVEPGDL